MPTCELCGKEDKLIDAIVEGALVSVCKTCASFGNAIQIKKPEARFDMPTRKLTAEPRVFELIIKDFAIKIKEARENLHFKQEEVAQKIAERISTIESIESGHLKPTLELAKKLENLFNIKLIEKYEEEMPKTTVDLAESKITIGDLLNLKRKK